MSTFWQKFEFLASTVVASLYQWRASPPGSSLTFPLSWSKCRPTRWSRGWICLTRCGKCRLLRIRPSRLWLQRRHDGRREPQLQREKRQGDHVSANTSVWKTKRTSALFWTYLSIADKTLARLLHVHCWVAGRRQISSDSSKSLQKRSRIRRGRQFGTRSKVYGNLC